jgi:hypothetical protein
MGIYRRYRGGTEMKKIEEIIRIMVDYEILEESFICEECGLISPSNYSDRWRYPDMPDDDGCPYEDSNLCPKNVLRDNSEKVAEAILNLDCVKGNEILFSALNKEIET